METPPEIGKPFAADDISFPQALEPSRSRARVDGLPRLSCVVKGSAREGLQRRNRDLRAGLSFRYGGHPLRALPLPCDLAEQIRNRVFEGLWARDYLSAMKRRRSGPFADMLSPVYVSKTLHGCRTLLDNTGMVNAMINKAFSENIDNDANSAELAPFIEDAIRSVGSSADRYDPDQGAKFTTFAHPGINGYAGRWRKHRVGGKRDTFSGCANGNRRGWRDC